MNCQHCQTDVPNADCDPHVEGNYAWVRGHCPQCGYTTLGRVKLTKAQKDANYHSVPYKLFKAYQEWNHSPWLLWWPEERA